MKTLSLLAALLSLPNLATASIAYGSINNFDTVNDTGQECHGFEIELDDCRSTDVTYTYNYNHYGVPNITEDTSDPTHPKCIIRWESKKNADGTWAAYTAIPAGPIAPTNGHMFTNPSVNFGGEHFGVGYTVQPSAIHYYWLIDSGSGALLHGGAVQVSTPTFTYFPPVAAAPAQVQAVIAPPAPPAPPPLEFGPAVWVKEIRTTTHNAAKVKLRELVSDDPERPAKKSWRNGEPDEVEVEWQILQKDYHKADGGANNQVPAAAENLPGGDEVVTRRYEFFKYVGPVDTESGEAMAQSVAPDGIHGVGTKVINGVSVNLDNVIVVGDFTGSQMAAVDVNEPVGLVDHVGEGRVSAVFAPRSVVVAGALPFIASQEGNLPPGMAFDETTGILSGTPTASGTYSFKVTASDGMSPVVAKNYTMTVAAAGAVLPPASLLDTAVSPVGAGTTSGDGSYAVGANTTVVAAPSPGFTFLNWTDNGEIVSTSSSYTLTMDVNHSLVASFEPAVPQWNVTTYASSVSAGTTTGDGTYNDGDTATVTAIPNAGYAFTSWTKDGTVVSSTASYVFTVSADTALTANFTVVPSYAVSTTAVPAMGGTTSGGGVFLSGTSVTVNAAASVGYAFINWTAGGTQVSASPSYTFTVTGDRSLVANFSAIGTTSRTVTTSASPVAGGATTGGGTYADGSSVTVTATSNPGYTFSKWRVGSTTVSTTPAYTFTVTADRTLVANFTPAYYITASVSPAAAGTTETDSVSYKLNENAKVTAFSNPGRQFVNWTENGTVVSTANPYSFNVTGDRTLVANFSIIGTTSYVIGTSSSPPEGGTTSGSGTYADGSLVQLIASPGAGYVFASWTQGGTIVSNSATCTFIAAADRTLTANFIAAPAQWTINTTAQPVSGGTVTGGGVHDDAAQVVLSAVAAPGYTFIKWTEGVTDISTSPTYSFTATADRNLEAHFELTSTGVKFDFDATSVPVALGQGLPLDQLSAGITATFSSPNGEAFTIGNAATTGCALANLGGKYLVPGSNGTTLEVQFNQAITSVSVNFALLEALNLSPHSTLQLTAIDHASGAPVTVGSVTATGINHAGDTLATGALDFDIGQPFDQVRIEILTAAQPSSVFFIDCFTVTPVSTGGGVTLINPNWNITLTDAGYSDLLLDNTPGFEGREYLSGEWGAAVGYDAGGSNRSPRWLERNYIYPDWTTNADFHVVSPMSLIGSNADGLPIAQSVIANREIEITIRCEMIDTVTGVPMGTTAASSAGAGSFLNSNRYVLNQSYTVKNISGTAISNLQFFQFLHGLTSQHGVYDNRPYAGKHGDYRHDVTLGGIDAFSIGVAGASTTGFKDFIGFASKTTPSAWEIGHYGIEGNGIDDHSIGKPSDGVHLSIEDNWTHAPWLGRKGTDFFAPADRWIAGAQRYELGLLADGQSATVDVMLSILTGTTVAANGGGGSTGSGSCNGGATHIGGVDFEIEGLTQEGTFFGQESEADDDEINERVADGEFKLPDFAEPGGLSQVWNLSYGGAYTGRIKLKFNYDPSLLPAGFDASKLTIWHFTNGAWEQLVGMVDTIHHTLTITTTSLSPFVLGIQTSNAIPTMSVTLPANGTRQLQWSGDTSGWTLQESTDLTNWTNSPHPVAWANGISTVIIPDAGRRFFRLAHP